MITKRLKNYAGFLMSVVFMLAIATSANANGTAAGDSITNGVIEAYTNTSDTADTFGDIILEFVSATNPSDTRHMSLDTGTANTQTVLAVYGDTMAPDNTTGAGTKSVTYQLVLQNSGNITDSMFFGVVFITNYYGMTANIYADSGASSESTYTSLLAEDAYETFYLVVRFADTVAAGSTSTIELTAWAKNGLSGDTGGYSGWNNTIYAGLGNDSIFVLTSAQGIAYMFLKKTVSSSAPIQPDSGYLGGGADVVPGSLLTYRIYYDNDGGDSAGNITITEYIPQNTSFYDTGGLGDNVPDSNNTIGTSIAPQYATAAGAFQGTPPAVTERIQWPISNPVSPNDYGTLADDFGTANDTVTLSASLAFPDRDAGRLAFRVTVD